MRENKSSDRRIGLKLRAAGLCAVVALIFNIGVGSQVNASLIAPVANDSGPFISADDMSMWEAGSRFLVETSTEGPTLSLLGKPSATAGALVVSHIEMAAKAWRSSCGGINEDAIRFTCDLVQGASLLHGMAPLSVTAIDLGSGSPVVPISSSPSSVFLFVPALVGLLGAVFRERSCLASCGSDTESVVEQRPSGTLPCLLVLSADSVFATEIQEQVHRAGFSTRITAEVHDTLTIGRHGSPALLLVDRRVADWDMLRTSLSLKYVPLITLVPRGSLCTEEQWMSDLERGADGFHDFRDGSRLFVAKVGSYLRRTGYDEAPRGTYQVGAVELDADIHEVKIAGQRLELSAKPFAILKTLMQAPSKVFSRHELVDRVWGPQFAVGEHTLDVHVHALRQQLDRDPNRLCRLITIKGVGFKLKAVGSVPSSFAATIDRTAHAVAADGTDGLRSAADPRTRNNGFDQRCQSPSPQVPVLKRVARRRSGGMPRRPTGVAHLGNAALAG